MGQQAAAVQHRLVQQVVETSIARTGRLAAVPGASTLNRYSARQPSRVTCQGSSRWAITEPTLSADQTARAFIRSKAVSVKKCSKVARDAVMHSAFPARVPPTMPTSASCQTVLLITGDSTAGSRSSQPV